VEEGVEEVTLSQHAFDRIRNTRFNLNDEQTSRFMKQVSSKNGYKLIQKKRHEIRQVTIDGIELHAVINNRNIIITVLPDTMIQDEETRRFDYLTKEISRMQKGFNFSVEIENSKNIFQSIKMLIAYKKKIKEK